jgi:hypothetical protein
MSKSKKPKKTRLTLHLGSREEALNLYSILVAFQVSDGAGILNQEALATVGRWVEAIEVQVPGIKALAGDTRGPFREKDYTPLAASLVLDEKERSLMLFVCQVSYSQLLTPEGRQDWIRNQGRGDYEVVVKSYRRWIESLSKTGS